MVSGLANFGQSIFGQSLLLLLWCCVVFCGVVWCSVVLCVVCGCVVLLWCCCGVVVVLLWCCCGVVCCCVLLLGVLDPLVHPLRQTLAPDPRALDHPNAQTAQNCALFSPFPPHVRSFFLSLSLGVFSLNFGVWTLGLSCEAPGLHTTARELLDPPHPVKMVAGEGQKKSEILGGPAEEVRRRAVVYFGQLYFGQFLLWPVPLWPVLLWPLLFWPVLLWPSLPWPGLEITILIEIIIIIIIMITITFLIRIRNLLWQFGPIHFYPIHFCCGWCWCGLLLVFGVNVSVVVCCWFGTLTTLRRTPPPGLHMTARELQTRTFEGSGASKQQQNSTRRHPERHRKSKNGTGEWKNAKFWVPTVLGPALRSPALRGPTLRGPDFSWVWAPPFGPHNTTQHHTQHHTQQHNTTHNNTQQHTTTTTTTTRTTTTTTTTKWIGQKWIGQQWIGQNWFWPKLARPKPRWPNMDWPKLDWPKLVKSGWPKRDWPKSVPFDGPTPSASVSSVLPGWSWLSELAGLRVSLCRS